MSYQFITDSDVDCVSGGSLSSGELLSNGVLCSNFEVPIVAPR